MSAAQKGISELLLRRAKQNPLCGAVRRVPQTAAGRNLSKLGLSDRCLPQAAAVPPSCWSYLGDGCRGVGFCIFSEVLTIFGFGQKKEVSLVSSSKI